MCSNIWYDVFWCKIYGSKQGLRICSGLLRRLTYPAKLKCIVFDNLKALIEMHLRSILHCTSYKFLFVCKWTASWMKLKFWCSLVFSYLSCRTQIAHKSQKLSYRIFFRAHIWARFSCICRKIRCDSYCITIAWHVLASVWRWSYPMWLEFVRESSCVLSLFEPPKRNKRDQSILEDHIVVWIPHALVCTFVNAVSNPYFCRTNK